MCEKGLPPTKEKMTPTDSLRKQVEEILDPPLQKGVWRLIDKDTCVDKIMKLLTPQVEMGEMNNTEDGKRFAILGMAGLLLENGIHDDSTLTINKPVRLAERLYKMVEQYWRIELKRQQLTKEEGK